jgi:tetratricopeptide (TPR) repeat protein
MQALRHLAAIGLTLLLAAADPFAAAAVDSNTSQDAPDLRSVRAKIKSKDWQAAIAELTTLADKVQHADVYNLLGFSLRNAGDYRMSLTYYQKALDFDPNHKSAHEYLGELYVKMGDLAKAREHAAILARLCPRGCEERDDLDKAIRAATR